MYTHNFHLNAVLGRIDDENGLDSTPDALDGSWKSYSRGWRRKSNVGEAGRSQTPYLWGRQSFSNVFSLLNLSCGKGFSPHPQSFY